MRKGDLTNVSYWSERQKLCIPQEPITGSRLPECFYIIEPFLRRYEGKRFIELGCSPGDYSALICSQIKFIPYGIDFSQQAYLYKEAMARIGQNNATLIISDIRDFKSEDKFDVVTSFGLIEHFKDPTEMMFHHHRLAKTGGLIIMTIPNFRYIQWLYHFLFDRKDLAVHNIDIMNLNMFRDFSEKFKHNVLYLGYVGRLRFWNAGLTGSKVSVLCKRILSKVIKDSSNKVLSEIFPANSKYYAPFIVYVSEKQ